MEEQKAMIFDDENEEEKLKPSLHEQHQAVQNRKTRQRESQQVNELPQGAPAQAFPLFCLTNIAAWTTHWSQSSITDGLLANKFAAWNWAKSRTFAFPVTFDWLAGKEKNKTREETNQQTNNKKKENKDEKENRTNNRNRRKTKHE